MALHHTRSLSLPSGSHPAVSQVDEMLSKLRHSEAIPSSFSSMTDRLNGLKKLYNAIDDLLQLPHIPQIISKKSQENWSDEILNGYITLLDACTTANFSCTKKDVQELLSAFRKRNTDYFHSYLASRTKLRKILKKSRRISSTKNKKNSQSLEKEHERMAIIQVLMEAESSTSSMLESLLLYLAATNAQSRQGSWSLVSKFMNKNRVSSQGEETESNELKKVDIALYSLISDKTKNKDEVKTGELMNHLKKMESSVQVLEGGLECLFRQLIHTRVLLLNILNH